ncbi:MAG: hypothetical protein WAV07_01040 [Candidatus Contendobacter sp.]
MIEKVVKIVPMRQPSSDYAYWRSRPVQERIDTLEMLRQQYIEFGKDADPGLQRILRVVNQQLTEEQGGDRKTERPG